MDCDTVSIGTVRLTAAPKAAQLVLTTHNLHTQSWIEDRHPAYVYVLPTTQRTREHTLNARNTGFAQFLILLITLASVELCVCTAKRTFCARIESHACARD